MSQILPSAIDRRSLLIGSASFAAVTSLSRATRGAPKPEKEFMLIAAPGRVPIVGAPYPDTDVWCFGNKIPGPEIRVLQGEPLRIVVENRLPEATTIH